MLLTFLFLSACEPETKAEPALGEVPSTLDFGTVSMGESGERTFTLENVGGGAIEVLSVSLVAGDAREWSVARDGFDPLDGSAVTTLTITFAPEAVGLSSAEVQVRTDAPGAASAYVELTGTGGPSTTDADGDGYSPADGDCDDGRVDAYPGADEGCNGRDDDCDGTVPADESDADGDGWRSCSGECDDANPAIHPEAQEICDDADSDCDGVDPDRDDVDGDGFSICDDDCDDEDAAARPDGVEVCDGIDNDCSGEADDIDVDGDGATVCGAAGDCDDTDPTAFPVFVDLTVPGPGTGTRADPFPTLDAALAAVDPTCRTIGLGAGTYSDEVVLTGEVLAVVGVDDDPALVVFTPAAGGRSFLVTDGVLTLANLTLADGAPSEGDGGAVRGTNASISLVNVVATGNRSTADGGAVALASGALSLEDCVFTDNVAGDDGGGAALTSGALLDDGNTWTGNAGNDGGAVFAVSSDVLVAGSTYTDNTATRDGGALAVDAPASIELVQARFFGNVAGERGGAAAFSGLATTPGLIANVVAAGNAASSGGGFVFSGGTTSILFANNTVVDNTADGVGAGVLAEAGLTLLSNVIAWNDGVDGLNVADATAQVGWNLGYATSGGTDFTLADGVDAGDNLVADPLLIDWSDNGDPLDDDLGLSAASPGVDSGPPDDALGLGRPFADPDGSTNDRGHTGGPNAF